MLGSFFGRYDAWGGISGALYAPLDLRDLQAGQYVQVRKPSMYPPHELHIPSKSLTADAVLPISIRSSSP